MLFPNIAREPSLPGPALQFLLLSPFMSRLQEGAFNMALDMLPPRGIPSSPQDGLGRGPSVCTVPLSPQPPARFPIHHPPLRTVSGSGTLLSCAGRTEWLPQQTFTCSLAAPEAGSVKTKVPANSSPGVSSLCSLSDHSLRPFLLP